MNERNNSENTMKLTELGYQLPYLRRHYIQFKNDLTLQNEEYNQYSGSDVKKVIKCFWNNKTNFYIPRMYGFKKFGEISFDYPKTESIDVTFKGGLRDYQQNIFKDIQNNFDNKFARGGILNLSTGCGKTIIALYTISRMKVKTVIFVHKQILLDQWKERIREFIPDAKIGIIQGSKRQIEGNDIVIAMIQTVSRNYKEFRGEFDTFGLTIIDEIHNICTEKFSRILNICQTKYRLGLTATLRKDAFRQIYEYHVGPIISVFNNTMTKPLIQIHKYQTCKNEVKPEYNYKGVLKYSTLITHLCLSESRNKYILGILSDLYSNSKVQKRKTIVFTDRVQQAEYLCDNINLPNVTADTFIGSKSKKKDLLEQALECDIIFATYGIAKEGFDLPSLDTLVFASPKSEIEQAVGRILRKKNNHQALVIDIFDENIGVFKGQHWKRFHYYKSKQYTIEYVSESEEEDHRENESLDDIMFPLKEKEKITGKLQLIPEDELLVV